ncbi:sensor histidine kinase [Dactylosporangium fulvum]|uniref:sensor histidine kinase n=1 Tax=Dactylosporangium fulvum TaxID=53359 RepID=UPI0031CF5380
MLWVLRPRWVLDPLLVAVLGGTSALALPDGRPRWVQLSLLAVLLSAVLFRRRYPGTAAVVVVCAAWAGLAGEVWREHLPLAHLAVEIMAATLVMRRRRRAAALVALAGSGFFVAWALRWYAGVDALWGAVGFCLSVAAAWLLAEAVLARRAYVAAERQAWARAAAARERARIAREVHDVLAHNVGAMVLHAEGARLARRTDPAVVDRTLDLVSSTGRAALDELRRLLDVLHDAAAAEPGGAPAGSAPHEVQRIVQESLTNVTKHAGADAAAEVRVEVRNSRGAGRLPRLPSGGHGLAGIRARVAAFGGTVDAAPTPDGGYRVAATLPVGGARAGCRDDDLPAPGAVRRGPARGLA